MSASWSREEENECIGRAKGGDGRAWEQLLEVYEPILAYAARAAVRRGGTIEDYMQQARMGLMHAVSKYIPDRGTRFWTYARWWVRAHVSSFAWANARIVPLPQSRAARRVFGRLRKTEMRLGPHAENGRIADEIQVDEGELAAVRASLRPDVFLDASHVGLDDVIQVTTTAEDALADARDHARRARALSIAVKQLDAREREIIHRRYLKETPETLVALGSRLGLSRERVRQLEKRALSRLRQAIIEAEATALDLAVA